MVNIVSRKGEDGRMEMRTVEREDPPEDLAAIAYATLEELEAGDA